MSILAYLWFRRRDTVMETTVLPALATLKEGLWQRIDGIRCEPEVISVEIPFFAARMNLLVRRGLLEKERFDHSIFASANRLPYFRLTDKARVFLTESAKGVQ